jgi:DNA topoisomerase-1
MLTTESDPPRAAKAAGLRYVSDTRPGIRRVRSGGGFRYVGPSGAAVRDAATLRRIKALAIPPAWEEVWISPSAEGHIQAAGRDARGRKQYRYHARWRAFRDRTKFARMIAFARALPAIRARVERDLALPGLVREKVLATVVRLLEETRARVGNREYERANRSYGLTTLKNHHARVKGAEIRLRFRGKGGRIVEVGVEDRRIARIVRACQELPGEELFQYVAGDGSLVPVDSSDVNDYLREAAGDEFTAKDVRTWSGTVLALAALLESAPSESARHGKKIVARAMETVAGQLRNTPTVCRKYYVHPDVIDAYLAGALAPIRSRRVRGGLAPIERALLRLLTTARQAASRGAASPPATSNEKLSPRSRRWTRSSRPAARTSERKSARGERKAA